MIQRHHALWPNQKRPVNSKGRTGPIPFTVTDTCPPDSQIDSDYQESILSSRVTFKVMS